MIVSEREFVQVQRQIVRAHLVVTAHNSALEQAPEAFNRVRMSRADNVFVLPVIDGLMHKAVALEMAIAGIFIGRHQRDFLRDGFLNEILKRPEFRIFDHLADDITLAAYGSDHHRLTAVVWALSVAALPVVPIFVFATDPSFVRFDLTDQLLERLVLHRGADARAHIPRGFIAAAANLPMDLKRAHSLLRLAHQVSDLKPRHERIFGVLEDRAGDYAEAIAV